MFSTVCRGNNLAYIFISVNSFLSASCDANYNHLNLTSLYLLKKKVLQFKNYNLDKPNEAKPFFFRAVSE